MGHAPLSRQRVPMFHHPHSKRLLPFPISKLEQTSFNLKPLTLVLSQQAVPKCPSPAFLLTSFRYWYKVSPEPSLRQAEELQLPQHVFITCFRCVLQTSDHLSGLLWTDSSRFISHRGVSCGKTQDKVLSLIHKPYSSENYRYAQSCSSSMAKGG